MEIVKTLGLDDEGRKLVLSRVSTGRGEGFECLMRIDLDGQSMTMLRAGPMVPEEAKRLTQAVEYADFYERFNVGGSVNVGSLARGSGKSSALFGMLSGRALLDSPSQGVSVGLDSIAVYDEESKPRVKIGQLFRNKKPAENQGHVARKPQPNRGPLGKRDWK